MKHISTPSISPFLFCENVDASLSFLSEAFGVEPGDTFRDDAGTAVNATARLGETIVFLSRSHPGQLQPANTLSIHHSLVMMYVSDVDAVFTRAQKAGAAVEYEPQDMPYGQRECGVRDLDGQLWSIATLDSAPTG